MKSYKTRNCLAANENELNILFLKTIPNTLLTQPDKLFATHIAA